MPEYLSPGVFIEELAGPKPIEGVGTSTGAFVGLTVRGPINEPRLITNMTQYADTFGGFNPDFYLPFAVRCFFVEGGTRCYVARVFRRTVAFDAAGTGDATDPKLHVARLALTKAAAGAGGTALTVFATSEGSWGNTVSVQVAPAGFIPPASFPAAPIADQFQLRVFIQGVPDPVEIYDNLSMNEFTTGSLPNPNHVEARINGISQFIIVKDTTNSTSDIVVPFSPAAPAPPLAPVPLALGGDGRTPGTASPSLTPADLVGTEATSTAKATGLHSFDAVDDINIVAIPDAVHDAFDKTAGRTALNDGMTYCLNRQDCFFVADTVAGLSPQQALDYKRATGTFGGNAFNSKYGALYYPWIYIINPLDGKLLKVPPSGAVAGSYSASDVRVGVHKAPAGIEDGYLNSAAEIERVVTKGEHDVLNPQGINVIRKFADYGIVIYGARTVSSDPEWKYVNVRRLFIFLEESILKGTQGVVFEPNDFSLWKRITRDVSAFLRIQWSEGKLVGDKPEKAFFVKCDAETNPPESIDLGRVITLIGVAPSKPAEFVIFRIRQTRSGGSATE
jgi:phage tail sheath protein FI